MHTVIIERPAVNLAALDSDLRAALGAAVLGVSAGPGRVAVHLADFVTADQVQQARVIAAGHDPARLSPAQQAAIARGQKLEAARRDLRGPELDLAAYAGQTALLARLAQKIAWLEQELLALREGL